MEGVKNITTITLRIMKNSFIVSFACGFGCCEIWQAFAPHCYYLPAARSGSETEDITLCWICSPTRWASGIFSVFFFSILCLINLYRTPSATPAPTAAAPSYFSTTSTTSAAPTSFMPQGNNIFSIRSLPSLTEAQLNRSSSSNRKKLLLQIIPNFLQAGSSN